ncbi:LIM domain containing 2 [Podarcis lilfordi]|nr:LIM domain containing 2 [Podarcis lilfordi]
MAATHQLSAGSNPASLLLSQGKGRREWKCHVVTHLQENKSDGEEALLTRRKKASPLPSTTLGAAATCASRKVNSYEKTLGVLNSSGHKSHILCQGHRTASFPSVKERSVLYLSQAAAAAADLPGGLTESAGVKEVCASCSKPVYTAECMAIQNVPLHHACFCCKHCRRKLSLANYATFQGTFYCKSHHQLLAGVKKRSQEENAGIHQRDQQLQIAVQPSPGLGTKNRNNRPGKLLAREKMQPPFSGLYSQAKLRPPSQARQENNPRTNWPPLKEAAGKEIGRKYGSPGPLQDAVLILQCRSGADGSRREAPGGKSIAESARAEKKQSQLPRVPLPKHGSHWIKTAGGSGDLRVSGKRQLFTGESIPGAQGRKNGLSIAERAVMFQGNPLKMKKSVPVVSPLTSTPLESPSFGSLPSRSEALRTSKATCFAASGGTVADASSLAKGSLEGKRLSSGSSSSTSASDERRADQILLRAELLPKARVPLPALAPADSRQKLPEASKGNMSITLACEEAGQLSHISAKPTEDHKPSQAKAESSVYLPEHKGEQSNDEEMLGSSLDSVETGLVADQVSENSWEVRIEFPKREMQVVIDPASLQRPENQLYPETHNSMEAENRREKGMQAGGDFDSTETQNGILQEVSQNSKPEERATNSDEEAEIEGHSASSSQAEEAKKTSVPQRNNSQDSTLTSNTAPFTRENLEPSDLLAETANTNEEIPGKASSDSNIQLEEETVRRTILQASKLQVKDQETFDSCEVPHLTEKQEMGSIKVVMKPQSEDGSGPQAISSKETTKESARKQKERNPLARLFASKTQGRACKQEEPAVTKKALKTQSALATLFGYSLEKDKIPKAKPTMKTSSEEGLSLVCFSNLPKLGTCKESETSGLIQAKGSEAGLQDPEENYGSHTRDGQRESSPSLDSAKAFSGGALPIELSTDISSSTEVASGMKGLEVPKQSNLQLETVLSDNNKSSLFSSFQDSLATPTENPLQCSTSSLMETKTEITSRGDPYDQDLQNFPNQAAMDAQCLEIKAENVSLLGPSREDKAQCDYQVPDMLLFSMGVDRAASMDGSGLQSSSLDLDTGSMKVKNEACSGLSGSENISEVSNLHQFSESEPIRAITLNNSNTPGTGNSEMFQNPQSCLELSEDVLLGLHVEKATADGYSTGKVDIPSLLGSLQHIPELLRDTIQRNTEGTTAATEQSLEEMMSAEKSDGSSGSLL